MEPSPSDHQLDFNVVLRWIWIGRQGIAYPPTEGLRLEPFSPVPPPDSPRQPYVIPLVTNVKVCQDCHEPRLALRRRSNHPGDVRTPRFPFSTFPLALIGLSIVSSFPATFQRIDAFTPDPGLGPTPYRPLLEIVVMHTVSRIRRIKRVRVDRRECRHAAREVCIGPVAL